MGLHGIGQVLLVGEDEDDGVPHLPVIDDAVQLLAGLVDAVAVGAVHHEDQALGPGVVMPPERPDLVLAAHVPHVELDVFVSHRLHVEAHGGDGGHRLAQLQLVQDGCLAGRVQAQHEDPHLLVPEDLGQHLPHRVGGAGAGGIQVSRVPSANAAAAAAAAQPKRSLPPRGRPCGPRGGRRFGAEAGPAAHAGITGRTT